MLRASLGLTRMERGDILSLGYGVYEGMKDNPHYPDPPVDMARLKAKLDSLSFAIAEALDGGRKAIARRNDLEQEVMRILRQLRNYVEDNCKDDVTIFVSSGFQVLSTTRTILLPLSEAIRRIDYGSNSGQVQLTLVAVPGAASYQLRWAPVGAGGTAGEWTIQPVAGAKRPTLVTGLTPGTTYAFQVRAVIRSDSSLTDWSDPLTKISM